MSEQQQQARILIAEDEANLRLVLQKELERLGYRVQAAPDGEAALRKLDGVTDDAPPVDGEDPTGAVDEASAASPES